MLIFNHSPILKSKIKMGGPNYSKPCKSFTRSKWPICNFCVNVWLCNIQDMHSPCYLSSQCAVYVMKVIRRAELVVVRIVFGWSSTPMGLFFNQCNIFPVTSFIVCQYSCEFCSVPSCVAASERPSLLTTPSQQTARTSYHPPRWAFVTTHFTCILNYWYI